MSYISNILSDLRIPSCGQIITSKVGNSTNDVNQYIPKTLQSMQFLYKQTRKVNRNKLRSYLKRGMWFNPSKPHSSPKRGRMILIRSIFPQKD